MLSQSMASYALGSPVVFRNAFQRIRREWSRDLTPSEQAIVYFILDRTYCWQKKWEFITLDHFEDGVWQKEKLISAKTGLRRRAIINNLKSLIEKGMVAKEIVRGRPRYSLALDEDGLSSASNATKGAPNAHRGASDAPKERIIAKKGKTQKGKTADAGASAESGRKEGSRRSGDKATTKVAVAKRIAAPSDPVPTRATLLRLWRSTFRSAFNVAPLTLKEKELHALSGIAKTWAKANKGQSFGELFVWSIEHWRSVMHDRFRKMESKPELPTVLFFVRFFSTFEECYRRREEVEAIEALPERERIIRRIMETKGMSYEAAEETHESSARVVREKEGIARERKKLEQAARAVTVQNALLSGAEDRIERHRRRRAAVQTIANPVTGPVDEMPETFGEFGQ